MSKDNKIICGSLFLCREVHHFHLAFSLELPVVLLVHHCDQVEDIRRFLKVLEQERLCVHDLLVAHVVL